MKKAFLALESNNHKIYCSQKLCFSNGQVNDGKHETTKKGH